MNFFSDGLARRLPFFYGYLMLPMAILMQLGTSPGQTFAVSAFTPSLLAGLDLTQSRLGLAYMLGTLCAAVPLTFVGPAADRHGLNRWSASGVLLAAISGPRFTQPAVEQHDGHVVSQSNRTRFGVSCRGFGGRLCMGAPMADQLH